MAAEQLLLAARVIRWAEGHVSPAIVEAGRRVAAMLGAVVDPVTGEPPNHGANDGSYILPLSTRPYRDFTPTLTALAAELGGTLPSGMTADEATLAWLGRTPGAKAEAPVMPRVTVGSSGWVSASTARARLFARAGKWRSRPSHIDPLHVDLWLDGQSVLVDAGSYRYQAPAPWAHGLAAPEVHNTVTIEGLPVAAKVGAFLWLRWPEARIISAAVTPRDTVRVVLENLSWKAWDISHVRYLELLENGLVVVDELGLASSLPRAVTVQWLFEPARAEVDIAASAAHAVHRTCGDDGSTLGWTSEHYADKRPAVSVRAVVAAGPTRFRIVSAFGGALGSGVASRLLRSAEPWMPDDASDARQPCPA